MYSNGWHEVKDGNLPPVFLEVLLYCKKWESKTNPTGVRLGYFTEDGDFCSAKQAPYYNDNKYESDFDFSPTHYMYKPGKPSE